MSTLCIHPPAGDSTPRIHAAAPPRGIAPADSDPIRSWQRLWSYVPTDRRDEELIARERRGLRWSMVHRALRSAFGDLAGLRTIELGSGRGDLSALLAEAGAEVTLLDASSKALEQADRRFNRLARRDGPDRNSDLAARCRRVRLIEGDLFDNNPPWAGQFDVALSSGVIEHFAGETRTHAVAAHRTAVRDGGMAIISVPNAWCFPYRLWKSYLELRRWWPYGFERPYTRNELVRRAHLAGLRRVHARCAGFWQSVGDHLGRSLLGAGPDWVDRRSPLDARMGLSVVLFGCR